MAALSGAIAAYPGLQQGKANWKTRSTGGSANRLFRDNNDLVAGIEEVAAPVDYFLHGLHPGADDWSRGRFALNDGIFIGLPAASGLVLSDQEVAQAGQLYIVTAAQDLKTDL